LKTSLESDRLTIINLRVTYKRAKVSLLEALAFEETESAMKDIRSLEGVDECVVLQTCHRVEVYAVSPTIEVEQAIIEYWLRKAEANEKDLMKAIERAYDTEALRHLLRLASGLESMIVGEDQILGQVKEAYLESKNIGSLGRVLDTVFLKAVNTGKIVRLRTNINKGAVSIGSAAVDLAQTVLGGLEGKKILLIGAGEIGTLVGKALAEKGLSAVFVANRTYRRAHRLAQMLGGEAVHFNRLDLFLSGADIIIVATAAPHLILTRKRLEACLTGERCRTVVIDLGQPRNVEEDMKLIPNVELFNIDGLRDIARDNLKKRLIEAKKAEELVNAELEHLCRIVKRLPIESTISNICRRTERIRRTELQKALSLFGNTSDEQQRILDDLTRVLTERILHYPISSLRKAAENGNASLISFAEELFDLKENGGGENIVSHASYEKASKDSKD